ncbi:hypothetical protein [Bacillus sp. RAR_GA_16]|uniref:hypothetical protein n=1 Tax=Bacillus sp. RAR_GA_16 TaxID=2876774 RepID=UPI001CCD48ED|nr:hypothetical protein [Bacillus sp. RAR_GA_16]MCA0172179.1 hypothetical protein [Bacillus sp. RAR_GA_16]
MWQIIGLCVAIVAIVLFERPLLKKHKKDRWIFAITLVFAFGLSMAQILDYHLPTPFDFITLLFKPVQFLFQ